MPWLHADPAPPFYIFFFCYFQNLYISYIYYQNFDVVPPFQFHSINFNFILLFLSQIFTYETDCLERDAASKIAYILKFSILFAWTSTTFMSINGILKNRNMSLP